MLAGTGWSALIQTPSIPCVEKILLTNLSRKDPPPYPPILGDLLIIGSLRRKHLKSEFASGILKTPGIKVQASCGCKNPIEGSIARPEDGSFCGRVFSTPGTGIRGPYGDCATIAW